MSKLVCKFGINDAEYKVTRNINGKQIMCPFYAKWKGMIFRCYSEKELLKRPSYRECSIDESWKSFTKFKEWMQCQDWRGNHLDKDLLKRGNKIYSDETCLFISAEINTFINECPRIDRSYLMGVYFNHRDNEYVSQINVNGRRVRLGGYDSEVKAHQRWLIEKRKIANEIALKQSDPKIAKALVNYYEGEFFERK